MTWEKLPINELPYKNVDQVELGNKGSDELIDGYVNEAGSTVKRPGLQKEGTVNVDSRDASQGLYWWRKEGLVATVNGGNIYKITRNPVSNILSSTDLTGDGLTATGKVSFTNDGTCLYMCNGGKIVFTDGTNKTAFIPDGDAPLRASMVDFLDDYILAADLDSNSWKWSNNLFGKVWSSSDTIQPRTKADQVTGILVNFRHILVFGTESIETWYNAGSSTPFERIEELTIETGCVEIGTITKANNAVYFMNNERRIGKLVNGVFTIISTAFDRELQGLSDISGATCDYKTVDGRHWLLFRFPESNKSYVHDLENDGWYQWCFWNQGTTSYDRFLGDSYCYAEDWNMHLVGDRRNGNIYSMGSNYYSDNGDTIRLLKRTGWIEHDDWGRKRSREIRFKIKRGKLSL